jgi:hypothetical protein
MASIGWTALPTTTAECGAYINGAISMTDCQKPAKIFCEEAYVNIFFYKQMRTEL